MIGRREETGEIQKWEGDSVIPGKKTEPDLFFKFITRVDISNGTIKVTYPQKLSRKVIIFG